LLKCWLRQLLDIFWKEFLCFFCVFDSTYLFEKGQIITEVPSLYKFAINYAIDHNTYSCYLLASRSQSTKFACMSPRVSKTNPHLIPFSNDIFNSFMPIGEAFET